MLGDAWEGQLLGGREDVEVCALAGAQQGSMVDFGRIYSVWRIEIYRPTPITPKREHRCFLSHYLSAGYIALLI